MFKKSILFLSILFSSGLLFAAEPKANKIRIDDSGSYYNGSTVEAALSELGGVGFFSNQTANTIFAGPGSGAAADPTFRALVDNDVPDTITLTNLTQITTKSHTALSDIGTNAHTVIDTFIASKAAASGLASLDISSLVVQNPANATATPTASKIPIADGLAKLDGWTTLGASVDISAETNLTGDTEIVLTGDALSIASTITRDTELTPYAPLASPTFTGTVTIPTPFTLGVVSVLPTGTELNYVDGVTSAIQAQIDGKQSTLTNSAGLAAALSDETGTGLAVFGTSPTFTTSIISPLVIGGTATTSDLALQTTSGVGAAGADMHFLVGNNGAMEAMTILNSGNIGVGSIAPLEKLYTAGNTQTTGEFIEGTGSIVSTAAIIPYIQLSSTANQAPGDTLETLVTFTNVDEQQTFTFTPTSGTITAPEAGVYFIIADGQAGKASGATNRILDMWIKKNDVDVPRSSVRNSIREADDTKVVIQNTGIRLNAGDTIKVYIAVSSATGSPGLYATTPGVGPVIPSIIFTMFKISQ